MPVERSKLATTLCLATSVLSTGAAALALCRTELLRRELASYADSPASASPEAVRAALLANPGMLVEAGQALQRQVREERRRISIELVAKAGAELTAPTHGVVGNPNGAHTVVEFFDYQCPHCREAEDMLREAARRDPELRILRREIAILGEGSELAARAALAAARQGRYGEVSAALMRAPIPFTPDSVLEAARAAGADVARLKADMSSEEVTRELMAAQGLSARVGVTGTPAFSAPGSGTLNGLSSADELRAFVASAGR